MTQPAETQENHGLADTTTSQFDVSVIIVNWNTKALLRDCIQSVIDQTQARTEIIVIDNCSSDGSAEMVAQTFPDVVLIANSDNRGFAGANNQGLAIAKGAHVLLLNPDTIVLDGAIDTMLAWLGDHPDVGCVGCQVLEGPEIIQRTSFSDPGPVNQMIVEFGLMRLARWVPRFRKPWYADWDRDTLRDVDVVSGMFMLVPKHVLSAVGPLDDAFFIYAEEADWCRRIRNAGWRCVFAPIAQIIHLDGGSKSTAQIRSKMHVQMQKSHMIYLSKHASGLGYAFAKAGYVLSAALRAGIFGLLGLVRPTADNKARVRLAGAALRFQIFGQEPTT